METERDLYEEMKNVPSAQVRIHRMKSKSEFILAE